MGGRVKNIKKLNTKAKVLHMVQFECFIYFSGFLFDIPSSYKIIAYPRSPEMHECPEQEVMNK